MGFKSGAPPRGFEVGTGESGELVISYRTTGMWDAGCFFALWLSVWTVGCLVFTAVALFHPDGIYWSILLFMVPFWVVAGITVNYVAWFFWSVTQFRFESDEMLVERSLLWGRRRQVFPRQQVTSVKQVKDGGEDGDSFPTWGLVILGGDGVMVLSRQPRDKSDWLGPVIAEWAGVPYIPWEAPEKEKYRIL